MEKILHLNVDAKYWNQVKSGEKIDEFRLVNDFWKKRLLNKDFDLIHYKLGYPSSSDYDKILIFEFDGIKEITITHEKFGKNPVNVFAISLRRLKNN